MTRQILWGVVLVLLVPFIVNQVSSRLAFSWTIWAALIALIIAAALIGSSTELDRWAVFGLQRRTLQTILAVLVAGAVGGVVAWALLPVTQRGIDGPVRWEFDGIFTMGTYGGDPTVRCSQFIIHGTNTGKPIGHVSGYIRSNLTNEKLPIYVVADGKRVPPEEILGIPPRSRVEIVAPFGPNSTDDVKQC